MTDDPAIVPDFTVRRRDDGRWGVYDIDGACIGSEATERLARCHLEGRDTAQKAAMGKGFDDEEQAYMRGKYSILKRILYPFGIVPEGEG